MEGCGGPFPSILQKYMYGLNDFPENYLHTSYFRIGPWPFVQLQAPLYTNAQFWYCLGGGLGVLPQNILGLNGVKSCNSRQDKYENQCPFIKAGDEKLDSFHNLYKGNKY